MTSTALSPSSPVPTVDDPAVLDRDVARRRIRARAVEDPAAVEHDPCHPSSSMVAPGSPGWSVARKMSLPADGSVSR